MSTSESSNPPDNPTLDNTELSDELKRLRELLNSDIDKKFDEKLQPLKDSISTLEKSQQNFKEQSLKVTKIEAENVKLRENCENIKKENEKLKLRLSAIEDKLLENHIILQGIPDQAWELKDVTREKVVHALAEVANGDTHQKRLDVVRKISINTVRRIGEYSKYRNRPVCVEFTNKISADFLMENKRKLKKGVYADRSYSDEINSARRKLMPILRKARSMEEYKGKCMLEGKYLIIKGKKYSTDNLDKLPESLSGFHVSSRENPNTFGFFGELSPFSNFHDCKFTVGEITYHSSEQYIQEQKAVQCGDTKTAHKILQADTPLECKKIARDIENFNSETWMNVAEEKCMPGIQAKFEQNDMLTMLLISTGNKELVECSYDKFWGCGVPLKDDNCLNKDVWNGSNLLGEILMKIRDRQNHEMVT